MLTDTILPALATFAFLALVMLPLERLFPRRAQPILRREWWTDLAFFAGQQLVWRGLALALLGALGHWLDANMPNSARAAIAGLDPLVQALLAIVLCDLVVYWGHRLSHAVPLLWRFHRVHHTAPTLDWLAAYREHPVDGLYTMVLENLPALALGFRLEAIAGFVMLRGIWAVFIHSNIRLPVGPLKYVLGSPELHHWHHHVGHGGAKNFANLMPLMDLVFGTYYAPRGVEPERLGTDEAVPHRYLAQLAFPFLPAARVRPAPADQAMRSTVCPCECPSPTCRNASAASPSA